MPKWLFSVTPPQWVLTMVGRCSRGPMPSFQWYSSAKHPPGQRSIGILICLRACDDVVADAPRVGDGAVLADPEAAVDAAAQVLGEVPVDVAVDGVLALVGLDRELRRLALRRHQRGGKDRQPRSGAMTMIS